jgi:CRISPR-associated protein Cas2
MALLISYDIEDNTLRQRIAHYIIDAGFTRVQYSVYMGTIKENKIEKVLDWLKEMPTQKRWQANDSILVLSLTQLQVQQMLLLGNPKWDKEDLSGEQSTLIL